MSETRINLAGVGDTEIPFADAVFVLLNKIRPTSNSLSSLFGQGIILDHECATFVQARATDVDSCARLKDCWSELKPSHIALARYQPGMHDRKAAGGRGVNLCPLVHSEIASGSDRSKTVIPGTTYARQHQERCIVARSRELRSETPDQGLNVMDRTVEIHFGCGHWTVFNEIQPGKFRHLPQAIKAFNLGACRLQ